MYKERNKFIKGNDTDFLALFQIFNSKLYVWQPKHEKDRQELRLPWALL